MAGERIPALRGVGPESEAGCGDSLNFKVHDRAMAIKRPVAPDCGSAGFRAHGTAPEQVKLAPLPAATMIPPLMPKPVARRKTKKAVAKRFKVTGSGKVLRAQASRRHLLSSKNAKRKRQLAKNVLVDVTDVARIKENLPFG